MREERGCLVIGGEGGGGGGGGEGVGRKKVPATYSSDMIDNAIWIECTTSLGGYFVCFVTSGKGPIGVNIKGKHFTQWLTTISQKKFRNFKLLEKCKKLSGEDEVFLLFLLLMRRRRIRLRETHRHIGTEGWILRRQTELKQGAFANLIRELNAEDTKKKFANCTGLTDEEVCSSIRSALFVLTKYLQHACSFAVRKLPALTLLRTRIIFHS